MERAKAQFQQVHGYLPTEEQLNNSDGGWEYWASKGLNMSMRSPSAQVMNRLFHKFPTMKTGVWNVLLEDCCFKYIRNGFSCSFCCGLLPFI